MYLAWDTSEIFKYKQMRSLIRNQLLPSLSPVFISFPSLPASIFLLVFISCFFPWLDLYIDPSFFPKTPLGSKVLNFSVQGQCPHRPVAGKRGQGCKPSFGSRPWWKDFRMCKSFRTKAADSVSARFSGSASGPGHRGDHPMWDSLHHSHNISAQGKWT